MKRILELVDNSVRGSSEVLSCLLRESIHASQHFCEIGRWEFHSSGATTMLICPLLCRWRCRTQLGDLGRDFLSLGSTSGLVRKTV